MTHAVTTTYAEVLTPCLRAGNPGEWWTEQHTMCTGSEHRDGMHVICMCACHNPNRMASGYTSSETLIHLALDPGNDTPPDLFAALDEPEQPAPVPPSWLVPLLESTPPSVPEPAPVPGGEDVTPRLLEWLGNQWADVCWSDSTRAGVFEEAAVLVKARAVYGWNEYHRPLQTRNSRNPVTDRLQEGADGMQYVEQAFLECADLSPVVRLAVVELAHLIDRAKAQGCDLGPIRRLLPVLSELVEDR